MIEASPFSFSFNWDGLILSLNTNDSSGKNRTNVSSTDSLGIGERIYLTVKGVEKSIPNCFSLYVITNWQFVLSSVTLSEFCKYALTRGKKFTGTEILKRERLLTKNFSDFIGKVTINSLGDGNSTLTVAS